MRVSHICLLVAAATTWFLASGAEPVPSPIKNGLVFSGLQVCPIHRQLVFEVSSPNGLRPDTVYSDVTTGRLYWGGGPIRGLCAQGDTLHAATLLGFYSITPDTTVFTPWEKPLGQCLAGCPMTAKTHPGQRLDEEQPFPERYREQADGTLVFLVDAEHPPSRDRRWHDLHIRAANDTEWLGARNLAVYDWVLSQDKVHWALAALAWVPDYGGQEEHILLAGTGKRVERFQTGPLEVGLWDAANRLWAIDKEQALIRIQPRESAWEMTSLQLAEHRCSAVPVVSDSVWTWVWPERFQSYPRARTLASRHGQGWVAHEDDVYWACWTGFRNAADLERSWPQAPVAGTVPRSMAVLGSDFLGTARHFRSSALGGEASLMHVLQDQTRLSELWWRYPGQDAVRLAGPWTAETHD